MKVLVTGTDGYIGTRLAPTLTDHGHDVDGLDTGFYRDGWLENGAPSNVTTIRKDIREVAEDDLRGYDAVVHLAELSNDPLGENDPQVTYNINYHGSIGLAQACKRAGVPRF